MTAGKTLALLLTLSLAAAMSACGGSDARRDTTQSSRGGLQCPSETKLYGRPPPMGKRLFCADLRKSGAEARHGPSIDWSCGRCRRGASLRGEYVLGHREGEWRLVSAKGKALDVSRWHNGVRVGAWRGWHVNGKPHFSRRFDATGAPDGKEWRNYRNGQREFEGTWTKGQKAGRWRQWSRSGALISEGRYKAGARDGPWKTYAGSGSVATIVFYEAGKPVREGQYIGGTLQLSTVGKDGKKLATWTERNGKKHGEVTEYYRGTTTLWRRTTWRDGVQTGPFTVFRRDGTKRLSGQMRAGKPRCSWQLFDADGRDRTRLPVWLDMLAAGVLQSANQAGAALPTDRCAWTIRHAVKMRAFADTATTVAMGRWLLENEVARARKGKLPQHIPTIGQRYTAVQALQQAARAANEGARFAEAALLIVAALLEIDRVHDGKLLNLPATSQPSGGPTWRGPDADASWRQRFWKLVPTLIPTLQALLWEKERGEKPDRKACRVTIGKIGITKLNFRAFRLRTR